MTRSYWNGMALMIAAIGLGSCVCLTLAQSPTPPVERYISIGAGSTKQRCQVLQVWTLPSGGSAYQVRAVDTGELITVVRDAGDEAAKKEVSVRIFRWVNGIPPNGTPVAPPASSAHQPAAPPAASAGSLRPKAHAEPPAPAPAPVSQYAINRPETPAPIPAAADRRVANVTYAPAPTPPAISWAAAPPHQHLPVTTQARPPIDPSIDSMGQSPWARSEAKLIQPGRTAINGSAEECEPRVRTANEGPSMELPVPRTMVTVPGARDSLPPISNVPTETRMPTTPPAYAPPAPQSAPPAPFPAAAAPSAMPVYQQPIYAPAGQPQAAGRIVELPYTPPQPRPYTEREVVEAPLEVSRPSNEPNGFAAQRLAAEPAAAAPVIVPYGSPYPGPMSSPISMPAPSPIHATSPMPYVRPAPPRPFIPVQGGYNRTLTTLVPGQMAPAPQPLPRNETIVEMRDAPTSTVPLVHRKPVANGLDRTMTAIGLRAPVAAANPYTQAPGNWNRTAIYPARTNAGRETVVEVREVRQSNVEQAPLALRKSPPPSFNRTLTSIGLNPNKERVTYVQQTPAYAYPQPLPNQQRTIIPEERVAMQQAPVYQQTQQAPPQQVYIIKDERPVVQQTLVYPQPTLAPQPRNVVTEERRIVQQAPVSQYSHAVPQQQPPRTTTQQVIVVPPSVPSTQTIVIDERPTAVATAPAPRSTNKLALIDLFRKPSPAAEVAPGTVIEMPKETIVIQKTASAPAMYPSVSAQIAKTMPQAPVIAAPSGPVEAPIIVQSSASVPIPHVEPAPATPLPILAPELMTVAAKEATMVPTASPSLPANPIAMPSLPTTPTSPLPTLPIATVTPTLTPTLPIEPSQAKIEIAQPIVINGSSDQRPALPKMPNMMLRPGEAVHAAPAAPRTIPAPLIVNGPCETACTTCAPTTINPSLEAAGKAPGAEWTSMRDRLKSMVGNSRPQPAPAVQPETIIIVSDSIAKPGETPAAAPKDDAPKLAGTKFDSKAPSTSSAPSEIKMIEAENIAELFKPRGSAKKGTEVAKLSDLPKTNETANPTTSIAPPPAMPGERIVTVGVGNKKLSCRVVQTWTLAGGGQAHLVKTVDTGDYITVVREVATTNDRPELPARVYRWTDAKTSPAGAPVPPPLPVPPSLDLAKVGPLVEKDMPKELPPETTKSSDSPTTRETAAAQKSLPTIIDAPVPANDKEQKPGIASTYAEPRPLVRPIPKVAPSPVVVTLAVPANLAMDRPATVVTASVNDQRIVSQLIQTAKEAGDPAEREDAVNELAKYDGRKHQQLVTFLNRVALTDPAAVVRVAAINALTRTGTPSATVVSALKTLRNDGDIRVRQAANDAANSFGLNAE